MTTAPLILLAFASVQCVLFVTAAPTTPRPIVNARFFCINPSNTVYTETRIDAKDIFTKLDVTLKFAFYVHGWTSSFEYDDKDSITFKIGQEWVKTVKTNFCGVDWRELADVSYSTAAKENIKTVGRELAAFIKQLHDLGVALDSISITGHSLGAHVAGYAGQLSHEHFNKTIDIIYALDPAGPSFTSLLMFGRSDYILSKADARYVQVLHTAIGTYGTKQFLGHADYYVNNGIVQTACIDDLAKFQALLFSCSHRLARDVFLSSFSHSCVGNSDEEAAESIAEQDVYGVHTRRKKGVFKMKTSDSEPYCM